MGKIPYTVYDYLYSLSLLFYYLFDILDSEPLEKSSLSFRSPRGSSSPIHPTLSGKNESRYSSPIQSTLSEVSSVSHLSKDCNDSASCHDSSNPSNYHFNSPDVTDETSISTSCLEEHCLENNPYLLEPLYVDSNISISGAICAIMHFCMAFRLSYSTIGELLKLLQLLCPNPNHLPTTIYYLKNILISVKCLIAISTFAQIAKQRKKNAPVII